MKRYLVMLLLVSHPLLFGVTTSAPVAISSAGTNGPPQAAVADNGNAIAVWTAFPDQIFVSLFSVTSSLWSAPAVLAIGSVPQVAIDQSGNAIVVWVSTTNQINASRFDVTTMTFSPAVLVSTTGGTNTLPQISMYSGGMALVIWIQSTPYQVLASSFNPSTMMFSAPTVFLSNTNPADFELDNVNPGVAVFQSLPSGTIQAARISVP